jgi:divalent metal cation (Fe/Co/Zn/Cd) transporter
VLNNAAWLDPVGGLVISLMVVQAGWGNTKSALLELADVGVESEMREKVEKAATKALESITTASEPVTVRYCQGVKAGQNYLMDVELGVVANSEEKPDFMDEFITGNANAADSSAHEHEHEHEHEHKHEPQSKTSDSSVRKRN